MVPPRARGARGGMGLRRHGPAAAWACGGRAGRDEPGLRRPGLRRLGRSYGIALPPDTGLLRAVGQRGAGGPQARPRIVQSGSAARAAPRHDPASCNRAARRESPPPTKRNRGGSGRTGSRSPSTNPRRARRTRAGTRARACRSSADLCCRGSVERPAARTTFVSGGGGGPPGAVELDVPQASRRRSSARMAASSSGSAWSQPQTCSVPWTTSSRSSSRASQRTSPVWPPRPASA